MKSRSEYEKSIYAKRDALIMKRKQRIATVTSLLCVVLCFAAAVVFLPKSIRKSALDTTTSTTESSTTAPTTVEDPVGMGGEAEQFFDESGDAEIEEEEYYTYITMAENYTKPATTVKASQKQFTAAGGFGYDGTVAEDSAETAIAVATQTEIAFETEIYWEDGSKPNRPSTTVKPLFNDHAEEKAIDAAFGYLTDEQKAKVDMDAHIDVSVTRNADGTEYFTVHLDTADGAYLVSVDTETFEFVKFKELKKTTQTVSQGYNPDATTAKPPMVPSTTDAPEYIPS